MKVLSCRKDSCISLNKSFYSSVDPKSAWKTYSLCNFKKVGIKNFRKTWLRFLKKWNTLPASSIHLTKY